MLGYTFKIDKRGKVTSVDADKVTLRAVRSAAADLWGSPLPQPFATMAVLERRYKAVVIEAPTMVGQTGEVIY